MESICSIFKCKSVCDQLFEIEDFPIQTCDASWPGVVVTVDEFETDLMYDNELAMLYIIILVLYDLTSAKEICMNGRLFIMDFPTPITITVPPLRTAYAAVQTLLSTPVHSRTVDGAKYSSFPNRARTAFAFRAASREGLTMYVLQLGTNS